MDRRNGQFLGGTNTSATCTRA